MPGGGSEFLVGRIVAGRLVLSDHPFADTVLATDDLEEALRELADRGWEFDPASSVNDDWLVWRRPPGPADPDDQV